MTLHQLKIFSSIAKYLNVTRASAELHISQPSVSQQVKLLQEEYGLTLYKKTHRGIRLTDDGRLFLKEIEPILVQFDLLKRRCNGRPKEAALAIGGSHSPSASFLPLVASAFRKTHLDTKLTLRTHNSDVLEQMVINSEIEIAVVTNSSGSPRLFYERCRQEELVLFASLDHPLAKAKDLSLADLASAPLVVFRRGRLNAFGKILARIERAGLNLNIAMYCESSDAVKAAVKAGMGVGVVYRDLAQNEINRKEVKVLQVRGLVMRSQSYIIYPKDRPLSVNAQEFLNLVRREIASKKRSVNGSSLIERPLSSSVSDRAQTQP